MKVRIGRELPEPIHIGKEVRQGCSLSPMIFNAYLEDVIAESMGGTKGIRVGGKSIECIRYADVIVLLAENEKALQMLENLSKGLTSYVEKNVHVTFLFVLK